VRNPFRSEADAFRFVWLTIGYFALIVLGEAISTWVGVSVFVVLTAGALWVLFGRKTPKLPASKAPASAPPVEHRMLVVANETVGGMELLAEIRTRAAGRSVTVLVVCPALNSSLRHWASDEDDARAATLERLDRSIAAMRAAGVDAAGAVGDGDPIQAIDDALRTFGPDELLISTYPAGRSHWLERGVVERARRRFDLPLTHVVVDPDGADPH